MSARTGGGWRAELEIFALSALALFLEVALIRWIPAHVLYLTFFTNAVLIASFLGLSLGAMAASRPGRMLRATPFWLALTMALAQAASRHRDPLSGLIRVGNPADQQHIFFGTELGPGPEVFALPIEAVGGLFFLLAALTLLGPGQEIGRALGRLPSRFAAYGWNLAGSLFGVIAFSALSWLEAPPPVWFATTAAGLAYFLFVAEAAPAGRQAGRAPRVLWLALLGAAWALSLATSGSFTRDDKAGNGAAVTVAGRHYWSPYYRVDYLPEPTLGITVNLLGHQSMLAGDRFFTGYPLPHILWRDSGGRPFKDVLVIGAGSGNDVSHALRWGARHVDAVEIDPVILRLGRSDHPESPFDDPRVRAHVNDGRRFLGSPGHSYDLIIYALVDSLVLHSGHSNLRLESYLLTREAFEAARRRLKPGGVLVAYNFYRKGWLVGRLAGTLREVFGEEPLVFTLPYRDQVAAEDSGGSTILMAGSVARLREAFRRQPEYWLFKPEPPTPSTPSGFSRRPAPEQRSRWQRLGPARLEAPQDLPPATDDWPFPYLRRPMIPDVTRRAVLVMAALSAFMALWVLRRPPGGRGAQAPERGPDPPDGASAASPALPAPEGLLARLGSAWPMFWLGAGFMLIETRAVVSCALSFGSTWAVNSAVFAGVLALAICSNALASRLKPGRLRGWYAGLFTALGLGAALPPGLFAATGWAAGAGPVLAACLPLLFAGVVFAARFGVSERPGADFGANVAGGVLGGLAENASMLVGFRGLAWLAALFYALSAIDLVSLSSRKREGSGIETSRQPKLYVALLLSGVLGPVPDGETPKETPLQPAATGGVSYPIGTKWGGCWGRETLLS